MDDNKEIYTDDLKDLKEIAELFKSEIDRTYRLVEEFYATKKENKGIEAQDLRKFYEMAIVYLMRYLEIFNRDFFIKFFALRPEMMTKPQKSKKDQEKLIISYDDVLENYVHGDPLEEIPRIMAERMYNEIFSYEKMDFAIFIKKLLDDYLDLDFTNECKKRRLEFGILLQRYKKYRNVIVHGKDRLSLKDEKFSVMELEKLIIEYIRLVEELVYPNYFKKSEVKDTINFDVEDNDFF